MPDLARPVQVVKMAVDNLIKVRALLKKVEAFTPPHFMLIIYSEYGYSINKFCGFSYVSVNIICTQNCSIDMLNDAQFVNF